MEGHNFHLWCICWPQHHLLRQHEGQSRPIWYLLRVNTANVYTWQGQLTHFSPSLHLHIPLFFQISTSLHLHKLAHLPFSNQLMWLYPPLYPNEPGRRRSLLNESIKFKLIFLTPSNTSFYNPPGTAEEGHWGGIPKGYLVICGMNEWRVMWETKGAVCGYVYYLYKIWNLHNILYKSSLSFLGIIINSVHMWRGVCVRGRSSCGVQSSLLIAWEARITTRSIIEREKVWCGRVDASNMHWDLK